MSTNLVFSFGRFVPDEAASIEELGAGRNLLIRSFPFVNGMLAVSTGFAGRRWRARCLLSGADISALAVRRQLLRSLTGVEDILSVCGESFASVVMPAEKLVFGRLKNLGDSFRQEVEMEFTQLREDELEQ